MPAPLLAAALPGLISAGTTLIERLFPDPEQADKAKLELFKMQQSGELAALAAETELAKGQLEINKEEAKAGTFRGGWRPFIGWAAGLGLFYNFVARPILTWLQNVVIVLSDITLTEPQMQALILPSLDLSALMPLVLGMLGLGGLRSWEKTKGLP